MDRRAWWATVHGVAKSRTRLGVFTEVLTEGRDLMYSQSDLSSVKTDNQIFNTSVNPIT